MKALILAAVTALALVGSASAVRPNPPNLSLELGSNTAQAGAKVGFAGRLQPPRNGRLVTVTEYMGGTCEGATVGTTTATTIGNGVYVGSIQIAASEAPGVRSFEAHTALASGFPVSSNCHPFLITAAPPIPIPPNPNPTPVPPSQVSQVGACSLDGPAKRSDGTFGLFLDLAAGYLTVGKWTDYAGVTHTVGPAKLVAGGYVC